MTTATKIKERPIIFSAPMVRAILDGRKTQTRRIVKPQPVMGELHPAPGFGPLVTMEPCHYCGGWTRATKDGACTCGTTKGQVWRPKFGLIGDRLWVREAWQAWAEFDKAQADVISPDARRRLNYPADGNTWRSRVRPSIYMPRWASRITLEITGVRVERLHHISNADLLIDPLKRDVKSGLPDYKDAMEKYRAMWDQVNGEGSWKSNPWVWVVEFKRVEEVK